MTNSARQLQYQLVTGGCGQTGGQLESECSNAVTPKWVVCGNHVCDFVLLYLRNMTTNATRFLRPLIVHCYLNSAHKTWACLATCGACAHSGWSPLFTQTVALPKVCVVWDKMCSARDISVNQYTQLYCTQPLPTHLRCTTNGVSMYRSDFWCKITAATCTNAHTAVHNSPSIIKLNV